jgi:UDP-glucose 4-epimerase
VTTHDPFWYGEKIVVTGGSGLIGRPLIRMLLASGAQVINLDKRGIHNDDGITGNDNYTYTDGNAESVQHVRHVATGAAAIIHLGAISGVLRSMELAMAAWTVNFGGTLAVCEAARHSRTRVVLASTNHVYGNQDGKKTDEQSPMLRLDTYSASKIAADYCVRSYAFQYGVPAVVMRNTNCYGEDDPHTDHIIPGTIKAFVEGKAPVIKSDGMVKKGYLHVDDVARAYMAATKYCIEENPKGEVFNITTDEPISTRDLVYKIRDLMGAHEVPEIMGKRREDDADENLDDTKARTVLGWKPQVSLREGLVRVIDKFEVRYGNGVPTA